MSLIFAPLKVYRHKIRHKEIEDISSNHSCYKIAINHPKIRRTQFSDVMVNGPYGLEPANGYCRKGTGSLFRDIRINNGRAEMIIEDNRNQIVFDPSKLILVFVS